MTDVKTDKINPQGIALLKEIENELPHITLHDRDTMGNREYERTEALDAKVKSLLVNLKLEVCNHHCYYSSVT